MKFSTISGQQGADALRSAFRQRLKSDTDAPALEMNWNKLESALPNCGLVEGADCKPKGIFNDVFERFKHLELGPVVYAAILIVALLVLKLPEFDDGSINKQQLVLTTLIDENRVLEKSLPPHSLSSATSLISLSETNLRLSELDIEIQRAYINEAATEDKIELWEARKNLLIDTLKTHETKQRSQIMAI